MTLKSINQKYSRILGLDTSSKSIAFALLVDGELIRYGQIYFKGGNAEDRLSFAGQMLVQLAKEFDVELVVFEENINVRSIKQGLMLGWFVGVCAGIMGAGKPIRKVAPLQWQAHINNPLLKKVEKDGLKKAYPKKSATWYREKGREIRKDKTRLWVQDKFGIYIESDDVTDAIGIAWFGYSKWGK